MNVSNIEFIDRVKKLIGKTYAECDCIGVIRQALGLSMSGTNWLWRSINNSAKYRYLAWRVAYYPELEELTAGDVVFMVDWNVTPSGYDEAPDCHHIGVYIGDGKVIHSSPRKGVRVDDFANTKWNAWGRMAQVTYATYVPDHTPPAAPLTDHEMLQAIYDKIMRM